MVEVRGLEPLNACVSDMCVNHLHHTSKTPHILNIPRLTAECSCQITPILAVYCTRSVGCSHESSMKMSMRQDSNLRASRCKRDDVATCRYASWIKWRESNSRIFHGKESLCHWATLEFAALLAAVTLVLTGSVVYLHRVTQMANCLDLQWVGWNCQDACNNAIYWIRTNVSSIAASALTTKLNARIVDTNVTLLYASLKIN